MKSLSHWLGLCAAFCSCSFSLTAQGQTAPTTPQPQKQPLFNGKDFSGWELIATPETEIPTVCHYNEDGSVALAGKPVGFLSTKESYKNFRLHVEWRWPAQPGNGGVLLHIIGGPKDRQWPVSFQVQTKNKAAGDVLPMAGATFAEPLTSAPGAATPVRAHQAPDSEKPVGEWNSCDIVSQNGSIEVTVNDVLQNKVSACSQQEGKIGFQFEGVPYEIRKVSVIPFEKP